MVRFGGLVFILGCGNADLGAADAAALGRITPLTLGAAGVIAGGRTRLTVDGAAPGETVRFFQSSGPAGNGPCPVQFGGVCLDLGGSAPSVGSAVADANGVAVRRVDMPGGLGLHRVTAALARYPGARVVLEVRSHKVPFVLEDGQIIGRLIYEPLTELPEKLYGQDLGSHYQAQGLKLSKHFR